MITNISVDSFKSLQKFSLRLEPGLNILVGPNGSGKSNILTFFSFLSRLMASSLPDAISRSGGAGSVFNKKGAETFSRRVSCSVEGAVNLTKEDRFFPAIKPGVVYYRYEFTIEASQQFDSVYFTNQRILMQKDLFQLTKKSMRRPRGAVWDVDIQQTFDPEKRHREVFVHSFNYEHLDFRYSKLSSKRKDGKLAVITELNAHFRDAALQYESLLRQCFGLFSEIYAPVFDMGGAEIINIVPSEVKKPEDSSAEPGINADGSGLAATLYQLKRAAESQAVDRYARVINGKFPEITQKEASQIFNQIQELASLVNPAIRKLDVFSDPFDNIIKLRVTVDSGGGEAILPFSAMSDGTIKWLALVTAILTYRSVFAIEEPENFLHPRMQQEVVSIMRADAEKRKNLSFVLMTTHSESLLNAALPDEAIVVTFADGQTKASRPRNKRLLSEEIRKSGFGLGHFYLTGALDNA